ncbi:MAG TPA: glucosaminidase domain-containing protein [Hanamia sp.]|nr:glucosaminidase domain-containing protein [Hanamia sp.]
MNKTLIILFFSLVFSFDSSAQTMTAQQYILKYKDLAISEMKRMGVPAAITLAQGLLETQNGNSGLLKESNNHFGIKCKSTWTAETVRHDDDAPGECFRKYKSAEDSYRDHSNFLRGSSRYYFLFKLNPTDYKDWAYGLYKAGYATNPQYPEILIKNIEQYNLQQYTLEGLNDVPPFVASQYKDNPETIPSQSDFNLDSNLTQPINLTINGSKALYVPKGTSLLAIATEHNINLDKLLAINDLTKDGILDKNQYVFLEKKQKEGATDYCISGPDETLYDISQRYGVILQNLYNYNQLTPDDFITAGTKIFLKPNELSAISYQLSAGSNQSLTSNQNAERSRLKTGSSATHEVLPRENLYTISKKYGVTIKELKDWNNISGNHLQIGQKLIVSK